MRCGIVDKLLFISLSDIHWQRGDLHEPIQVPAHLHARQSGGVSQQELLWAQSTHVSSPPTSSLSAPSIYANYMFSSRLILYWSGFMSKSQLLCKRYCEAFQTFCGGLSICSHPFEMGCFFFWGGGSFRNILTYERFWGVYQLFNVLASHLSTGNTKSSLLMLPRQNKAQQSSISLLCLSAATQPLWATDWESARSFCTAGHITCCRQRKLPGPTL